VSALAEMYVKGVSTGKVNAITEELCGHEFSASSISRINQSLDKEFGEVCSPPAGGGVPILDSGCPLREGPGRWVIRRQVVLVAIGINWDGRRSVLGVGMANRES